MSLYVYECTLTEWHNLNLWLKRVASAENPHELGAEQVVGAGSGALVVAHDIRGHLRETPARL